MAVGPLLTRLVVLLPVLIWHRILLRFRLGLDSKVAVVFFVSEVAEVLVPKEVMLGRVQIPVRIWMIPHMHFRAPS